MADESAAKRYYDDFSGWYERERMRGYHAMIDDLEVEATLPYARGRDVLELGCGTGLILERVAAVARSAVGLDLSRGMIEKAHARGLSVANGSVTALPFADESFDLVYSYKVLAHVPDIDLAIAEAARVTRSGGHMLLEFYNPWSVRYFAKRVGRPGKISAGRKEDEVFTRWDSPRAIRRRIPSNCSLVDFRGVRVLTPAAFVHKVPVVGDALRMGERMATDSRLNRFGGFLIAVIRKR